MRFALKNRRGPHMPIGSDAPKHLRKEIERRLDLVKEIKLDPVLIKDQDQEELKDDEEPVVQHIYRVKAVDSFKLLEQDMVVCTGNDQRRRKPPSQDLRFYLERQSMGDDAPLNGVDHRLIIAFVDSYSHARHDPEPFLKKEYKKHQEILGLLRAHIKENSLKNSSRLPIPTIVVSNNMPHSTSSLNTSCVTAITANTVIHRNRNHSPSAETAV